MQEKALARCDSINRLHAELSLVPSTQTESFIAAVVVSSAGSLHGTMSARRRGDDIIVLCVCTGAPTPAFGKTSSSRETFLKRIRNFVPQAGRQHTRWAWMTADMSKDSIKSTSFDSYLAFVFMLEAAVFPLDRRQLLQQEEIRAALHIRHSARQLLQDAPSEVTARLGLHRPPTEGPD